MERESKLKNYIVFLMDLVIVAGVFCFVILIGNPIDEFFDRIMNIRKIVYVPMVTVVIVYSFLDMYKNVYKKWNEIVFNSVLTATIGFFAFFIVVNIRSWQLMHINISFWIILLLLITCMMLERLLLEFLSRKNLKDEKLLIIARESDAYKIGYNLDSNQSIAYHVNAIYVIERELGNIDEYIQANDKIVVGSNIPQNNRSIIMELCQKYHKKVFMIPDVYDISIMRPRLTQIDDTPYLYLDNIGLTDIERDVKRVMDLFMSTVLILLLSPLFIVSILLVRFSSKGPVFFKQERVTLDNKAFDIFKFRTMINNAEQKTGAVLSPLNDHRVTKVGAFMRNTRLDELPQLFNVLIGDMSMIGPRPERPIFVSKYEKEISLYSKRHTVKAGISGLAQIMGKYSTLTQDKLRYDLIYIRSYSILLDIKILFLTLKTVILDLGSFKEENDVNYQQYIEENMIEVVKG